MSKARLPTLIATVLVSSAGFCESVPFDSTHWSITAAEHRFEEHLGRPSLFLSRGAAVANDGSLEDGVIEFDIALSRGRGFSGMRWHARDAENYEEFYLRHHQSGNPDASQYTPVFNGLAGWQIYTGPGYAAAIELSLEQWMHIKLVVSGDRADIYVDSEQPVLQVDLGHNSPGTMLGLQSNFSPAHFSNFSYRQLEGDQLVRRDSSPPNREPGFVAAFEVSTPFPEARLEATPDIASADLAKLDWKRLEVEESGIANLARLHGRGAEGNTVFARLRIHADEARVAKIRFGFSDRAHVYLNGQLLFAGNDSFLSRDYRFLGSVGLYDELYLRLRSGVNELLFAVSETFGGWGVSCLIEPSTGLRVEP